MATPSIVEVLPSFHLYRSILQNRGGVAFVRSRDVDMADLPCSACLVRDLKHGPGLWRTRTLHPGSHQGLQEVAVPDLVLLGTPAEMGRRPTAMPLTPGHEMQLLRNSTDHRRSDSRKGSRL